MPFLPSGLLPMLPSPGDGPFDSSEQVFELKWSGIRALAVVENARLRLVSQSGRDITAWFPELAGIAAQVREDRTVLDGEIVALGEDAVPDLGLIAGRLAGAEPATPGQFCIFQAYDILYAAGHPLLDEALLRRKEALSRAIRAAGPAVVSEFVADDGVALFEAAVERRLPGVIAKRKESRYSPGAVSPDWTEWPVYEEGLFVAGGYVLGFGREEPVAGLLLGEPGRDGKLRFVAHVQGGLSAGAPESLLTPYATPACPFVTAPALPRLVYWLRPELVCQVRFARREADGRLRFPVFVTMRPDIAARDLAPAPGRSRAPNA